MSDFLPGVQLHEQSLKDMRCRQDVRVARKEFERLSAIAVRLGVDSALIKRTLAGSISGGRRNMRERNGIWKTLLWLRAEILSRGGEY